MSTASAEARIALVCVVAAAVMVAPASANLGEITRESVSTGGAQSDQDSGAGTALSDDGSIVAFASLASNLVAADGNGQRDVFVRDRRTAAIVDASVAGGGAAGDGPSDDPALSGDGRYVAFDSFATNLVVGDTNGQGDVFVRDLQAGATVRVSAPPSGQSNGSSSQPAISADGRYVVFTSSASNLVAGDTNGARDVFVRDRDADGDRVFDEPGATTTARVSVADDGSQAVGGGFAASISADGEHVAFVSETNTSSAGEDVFVRDRALGRTAKVSVTSAGGQSGFGLSSGTSISADGRHVAFDSDATDLVPDDTNSDPDVFVRDRDADGDGVFDEPGAATTTRVSVTSDGRQADPTSELPSISADGRRVAFLSIALDLVGNAEALDFKQAAYVHDRDADGDGVFDEPGSGATSTTLESVASDGTAADAPSFGASIAPDGSRVAFASAATNLVADDTNGFADVFVHRLIPSADLGLLSVSLAGDGLGALTSSPAGIDCGRDCSQEYLLGTVVTLTATAGSGSDFSGFSGACTGTGPCTVTLDQARTVTASFQRARRALTVALAGDGQGTVTSSPAGGIACGSRCSQEYLLGTVVTLTATAGSGSAFTGFSGACTGTGPCTVTLDQARSVTATFKDTGNGTGPPPGGGPDTLRPVVSGLRVVPARFGIGSRLPRLAGAARAGTMIRFSLSERATVSLSFARRVSGRRVGHGCRVVSRRLRGRRRCTRYVGVSPVVRLAGVPAGAVRVRFEGRLSRRRTLRRGRYRLTVVATDAAGNRSKSKRTGLTARRRSPGR